MTDAPDLAVNLLLAGLLWLLLEALANGLYPLLRPQLQRLTPQRAAPVLMTIALLPLGLSALITALLASPGLEPWLVSDHCHAGTDCGAHSPAALAPPMMAVLGGLSLLLMLAHLGHRLQPLRRHHAALRRLGAAGACPQPQGHHLIDHPRALALTTGLWRPRVWLTKGLTQALSTEAVAIVLAHEHTHRQRRDPLRHLLAGLSRLLPHSRTLLTDLHQTSEHLADHHAATIGGPRQVAETLIQVQRLTQPPIGRGHSAFAEGDLTARIHRLLHPPVEPRHVRARLALFALILLGATLASVGPLHHFSEWVMGVG